MKKQFLFWILLFFFVSSNAAEINSIFVGGADFKLLHISNDHNSANIYAENYQHQKILIYQSNSPYPPDSSFMSEQIDNTDILNVVFECGSENGNRSCDRFFNRRTNQLSDIYPYILDYDAKKDVVAYYVKNKNLVIISRAFKVCRKPLSYLVKLEKNSDFGIKTKFLPMGDLQLDYEIEGGKDIIKIIHINLKKFIKNCR